MRNNLLTEFFRRGTALLLVSILPGAAAQSATSGFLRLTVIEGDGAFNDLKTKRAHLPVVKVVDESGETVAGAQVVFTLPALGPGGIFAGDVRSATTVSDEKGLAYCPAYRLTQEEGRFLIRVSATFKGKNGALKFSQSNTYAGGTAVGEKTHSSKWLLIIGLISGGATAALMAKRSGSSDKAPAVATTTLSASGVVVGGPR